MGVSLASAKRGVALTQEDFLAVNAERVSCCCCTALVFKGELQQIWLLARSNLTSCTQVSKRLVAYFEALIVISPHWRPSDLRIAAIADAHFNTCLANLCILLDVEFKAYMEHKAGNFFKAYCFVAQERSEEDEESAAAAAAAAAKAAVGLPLPRRW
jgi:hypothetical protein